MSSFTLALAEQLLKSGDWQQDAAGDWIDLRRVKHGDNPYAVTLARAVEQQVNYERFEDRGL